MEFNVIYFFEISEDSLWVSEAPLHDEREMVCLRCKQWGMQAGLDVFLGL